MEIVAVETYVSFAIEAQQLCMNKELTELHFDRDVSYD